jgi:hypothetical protein
VSIGIVYLILKMLLFSDPERNVRHVILKHFRIQEILIPLG